MLGKIKRIILILFLGFLSCQLFLKLYRISSFEKTMKDFNDAKGLLFQDQHGTTINREDTQPVKHPEENVVEFKRNEIRKPEEYNDKDGNSDEFEEINHLNIKADAINEDSSSTTTTPEQSSTTINYHGRNLMVDPPFKFDPNFKNPCWFEKEQLRCLPYMFLIGVKKCGTSDLFFRTSLHPDFIRPGFKEAQFFARKRFRGPEYDNIYNYVSMFDNAASEILQEAKNSSDEIQNLRKITGEGSPSNLHLNTHWQHLPGNEHLEEPKYVILDYIQHFLPKAKIMITFRDPVERLYSDYYHEYGSLMRHNNPNPGQFHEVVTKGVQAYTECFKYHTLRSCVYNPKLYAETRIQIQLGIYCVFWEDLRRLFPREQLLVLQNKNLHDKETTMKSVYKFLELRTLSDDEMKAVVEAKEHYTRRQSYVDQGPMFPETVELLQGFYRPFNKRMAELTADTDFLYGYGVQE